MGPNVKILMGQSFGSWTHGHGPMALGAWAAAARPPGRRRRAGGALPPPTQTFPGAAMGPGPGPWARPWAQAMGPCPCVQEPNLWPMSIFTFWPISMFSLPDV